MTVKELISELQKLNPEDQIYIGLYAGPTSVEEVKLETVYRRNKSEYVEDTCWNLLPNNQHSELYDELTIPVIWGEDLD